MVIQGSAFGSLYTVSSSCSMALLRPWRLGPALHTAETGLPPVPSGQGETSKSHYFLSPDVRKGPSWSSEHEQGHSLGR